MNDEQAPKSALELALERLRRKDEEAGVADRPLSDEQRARIAEIRQFAAAKLAEREILHKADQRKAGGDPAALEALEEQYRRDRERIASDRDRKIDDVRSS